MLYQPIFGDRALSDSLYRALIDRFCDSLDPSTQALLGECSLGFAPSPDGVKTFFIIAPSLVLAEELLQEVAPIVERVATIMVGVGQLAICLNPAQREGATAAQNPGIFPPTYMACKFFAIPVSEEFDGDNS